MDCDCGRALAYLINTVDVDDGEFIQTDPFLLPEEPEWMREDVDA